MRAARIVAAVLLRILILGFSYLGSIAPVSFLTTRPITALDFFPADFWSWNPGYWLTQGHLILILFWPAAGLARQILGRRDALIAALIGWAVLGVIVVGLSIALASLLTVGALPPLQVTASFIAAMTASEFLIWRGLSHRGARFRDIPLAAAVFAILFNVLTFDLDPALAGSRLFLQMMLYLLGAGVVTLCLMPLKVTLKLTRPRLH